MRKVCTHMGYVSTIFGYGQASLSLIIKMYRRLAIQVVLIPSYLEFDRETTQLSALRSEYVTHDLRHLSIPPLLAIVDG